MKATRRSFLAGGAAAATAASIRSEPRSESTPNGAVIARRHCIVREGPTPDFFEGMLLGNGDIGVCVTVRPDALGLHLGKSDSWDIRVSEDHAAHILPFAEILKLWERASEEAKRQGKPDMLYLERDIPFFREYTEKVASSYRKSWPRPWPCGIVWLHWDANIVRVAKQTLDPSNGHYELGLMAEGKRVNVHVMVNTTAGHICAWSDAPVPLLSVAYGPYVDASAQLPFPEVDGSAPAEAANFSCIQMFPATAPSEAVPHPAASPKDRNFALQVIVQGKWEVEGLADAKQMLRQTAAIREANGWPREQPQVLLKSSRIQPLRMDIALYTPRDHTNNIEHAKREAQRLARMPVADMQQASDAYWNDHWGRSAVELEDKELERWWYHNQYWLACCLRNDKVAPGLFGNWTSGNIGTAWHGDYHMNYNTQQVFWGVFSSNHVEQHFPYMELVESLVPMSEKFAKEQFGLSGAYFPHSAYPVPSQVFPYPAPPWSYEICETPWTVQSLWWHYTYTLDRSILERVYPSLKAAAQFIAVYLKHGDDGRYHVDPTVSPENWGCTVDFRLNKDCIMDLALIDFLLEAVVEASKVLKADTDERANWQKIRKDLAPYPRASSSEGEVWVDVVNAPVGRVYNVPVTLAPVFPGERVGLDSAADELAIARRSASTVRLEGGNDIVYQPLIRARLGMLDLKWFKQEVRYCLMPNGIVQDRVRQIGGRYHDSTDFDFMMRMGIWTENLSLPAVLNECMLQSYAGTLHVFPNTTNLGRARFQDLRAKGALLVSAAWDGKDVSPVTIYSERGGTVRIRSPWENARAKVTEGVQTIQAQRQGEVIVFETQPGLSYVVARG